MSGEPRALQRIEAPSRPERHRRRRTPWLLVATVAALASGSSLTACGTTTPGSTSSTRSTASTTQPAHPSTSAPSTTSPVPTGTRVALYEPFSANGTIDPSLRVTKTVSGNCVAAGVAGNSSFRCFAQPSAGIYDPCFAAPSATSGPLVCPSADPADTDVTRFDVGQLPSPLSGAPEVRPWAILLPDGQTCTMVNAAWGGLGPFGCQSSSAGTLADCHVPVQGDPWWTAMCQRRENSSSGFVSYRLDKVWT